jgi:hypothetical protein
VFETICNTVINELLDSLENKTQKMYLSPVMLVDTFVILAGRFRTILVQAQSAGSTIEDIKTTVVKDMVAVISEEMHFRWVLNGSRYRAANNTSGDGLCNYHSHHQVMKRYDHFLKHNQLLPISQLKELPNNAYDCWNILKEELLNTVPYITSPFVRRDLSKLLTDLHDILSRLHGEARPGFIPVSSGVWGTPELSGHLFLKDRPLLMFVYQHWANDLKLGNIFDGKQVFIVFYFDFVYFGFFRSCLLAVVEARK